MQQFTRRECVQLGLGAAAAALGGGIVANAQQPAERTGKPQRKIRKALGLGMIGDGATLVDKCKLAKELRFDGIEIDSPTATPMEQFLKAKEASGIEIPSVIDSQHWSQTLGDPDSKIRAAGVKALETALRDAKTVGASSVLLVPCVVNSKISYDDAWTRSMSEIRKVVPLAAELGVAIAVENVWNQFVMSPLEAKRYVDEFASPFVGWHFDVGNVVNYGWPEQWVRILGKRIKKLHIKEFSRKKRDAEGLWKGFDVELLEGDVGWPAVMAALDEVGYDGWGIAEVNGGDRARLTKISEQMDKIFAS
jgi:hexulose-6-phosphate isomerase